MVPGGSGAILWGMMAGTLVLLVTLLVLVAAGVRLVLRTERERGRSDSPGSAVSGP